MDEPRILKIRMPTDYKPYVPPKIEGPHPEPMTLAEINKISKRMTAGIVRNWIERQAETDKFHELLFGPTPEPTRWQKISHPFRWRWYRLQDAWLVLIGKRRKLS